MTYLFFDTETTGLPDFKMPPTWDCQPHICQIGAILTDGTGRVKAEMNFIIKPDGWEIPQAASDIHGIMHADAIKYGISIKGALSLFDRMLRNCETVVAHNIKFDLFLLEIESAHSGVALQLPQQFACTMQDSTDILQLPATAKMLAYNMGKYKNPNLQEAHEHFMGRKFDGAHDAMADVRACKDIFFAIAKDKAA